jgi:N-acetyl-gamma-glutamyl-phosphate reductase common form
VTRTIPAAVLGATGYVGGELLRLLSAHPVFEVAAAVSDSRAGDPIAAVFPHLAFAFGEQRFLAHEDYFDVLAAGSRLALFSAAPHGASARVVAAALDTAESKGVDVHVVDASADFRYRDAAAFAAVYGEPHGAPGLLPRFSSGLPEHVAGTPTPHVGHPGCFASAMLLACVPLLRAGLVDGEVFVAAVTGSTGSGRSPGAGTHHPERHSNLYAYKALSHRHAPEVTALAEQATGRPLRLHFVPHSGPYARGIHATLQARLAGDVTAAEVHAAFTSCYAEAPFVDIVAGTPRLKDVVASNRAQLGIAVDGDSVAVLCTIDNLVKGAAGGAVQWMNRLWGLDETCGLTMAAPAWT